jgi:hypothetical protein
MVSFRRVDERFLCPGNYESMPLGFVQSLDILRSGRSPTTGLNATTSTPSTKHSDLRTSAARRDSDVEYKAIKLVK